MGPHHACSYADAAADLAIDQKVMSVDLNPYHGYIDDWSRFRDDIMCMWTGSEEELLLFHAWINNLHPRLKFTIQHSRTSNQGPDDNPAGSTSDPRFDKWITSRDPQRTDLAWVNILKMSSFRVIDHALFWC